MMFEIPLASFDIRLGNQWLAEKVSLPRQTSLALIGLRGPGGKLINARLDLGKRAFIDGVPFLQSGAAVNTLVDFVSSRALKSA